MMIDSSKSRYFEHAVTAIRRLRRDVLESGDA